MTNYRTIYSIFGSILFVSALVVNIPIIIIGEFPNGIISLAIGVMCLCMAYLAPHFAEKDERAQKIRERAIYISYFWGLSAALVLMTLHEPLSIMTLTGYQALTLFVSFYICIVFLNMVYYAKKY